MSKKEIKLHMGILDKNGKLVEVPDYIHEFIETREKHWFDKIKEIDKKCGILLDKLSLTEKALELAVADKCKFENALVSTSLGFINGKMAVPKKEQWYLEKAKEMIKSE